MLPAFADWRVAYLGQDGRLHAVSLDSKKDVAGAQMPGLDHAGLNRGEAHASPDGRLVAYPDDNGMTLVDLTARLGSSQARRTASGLVYDMAWSADGAMLALGDRGTDIRVLRVQSFQVAPLPLPSGVARADLLGWIDASHLAVVVSFTGATGLHLDSLDITTGKLRLIAAISGAGLATPQWSLSPDGKQALLVNGPFRDQPYTPFVEVISTATGQVRKLPNTLKAAGSAFDGVAWRPGTATLAVATSGSVATGALWLIDTQRDAATQIAHVEQLAPKGAFPLGWAPGGATLIVSSATTCCLSSDTAAELRALTITADGSATSAKLTDKAVMFPWMGFVKTA